MEKFSKEEMTAQPAQGGNLDRYVVIHVATTCDEHGVYVTKDSAEVIELGWILLDAKTCEEVHINFSKRHILQPQLTMACKCSSTATAS